MLLNIPVRSSRNIDQITKKREFEQCLMKPGVEEQLVLRRPERVAVRVDSVLSVLPLQRRGKRSPQRRSVKPRGLLP